MQPSLLFLTIGVLKRCSLTLQKLCYRVGWLVMAVNHQQPKCVWNNSSFYITTYHVPDFGQESNNVEHRIAIFKTKSLLTTTQGMDNLIILIMHNGYRQNNSQTQKGYIQFWPLKANPVQVCCM